MARIKFENGMVVNFNGNPTKEDVEEVARKLGISKEPKKTGFLRTIGQEIAEPFVKAGATGYEALRGVGSLGGYGMAKLRGDEEEQQRAIRDMTAQRKYSAFGKEVEPVRGLREAIGTGVELGSYAIGGPAKTGFKTAGVLRRGLREAKIGAIGGGLMGAGEEMQREESTIGSVVKKATEFSLWGGGFGGVIGVVSGGISRQFAKRKKLQETILEQTDLIKKGEAVTDVAEKEIGRKMGWTSRGRVEVEKLIKDKEAKEVIKQGVAKENVALVKVGSDIDKKKMLEMVDIRVEGGKNPLYAMDHRASDVVGESFTNWAKHVENINKKAGEKLNTVASGLSGKSVNTRTAVTNFMQKLEDVGIKINNKGVLDFDNSIFQGLVPTQNAINNIWERAIKVLKEGDALQVHRMKKYIDEIVSYGKRAEGLSGKAEGMFKGLRHNIDEALDIKFPEYDKANIVFRDTIQELNNVGKIIGKDFRIGEKFMDKQAGVKLRGLMSHNIGRNKLARDIESLQAVAQKYGLKIDENIKIQARFADMLDDIFGSEAPTSFGGQVERSVGRALDTYGALGADVTKGNIPGTIVKSAKLLVEKKRGISQENLIKALRELLLKEKKTLEKVRETSNLSTKAFSATKTAGQKIRETKPGLTIEDITKQPGFRKGAVPETAIRKTQEGFKGLEKLTLKTVEKLKGKTTVSKQYIQDLTNAPDLKQTERDLVRRILDDMPAGKINVKDFANKVKTELLPLKVSPGNIKEGWRTSDRPAGLRYESITLPPEQRGKILNYSEKIYESPVKTSAGDIHFQGSTKNYFAHTRIEDIAKKPTRRIIELQSDLFQKGALERSVSPQDLLIKVSDDIGYIIDGRMAKAEFSKKYGIDIKKVSDILFERENKLDATRKLTTLIQKKQTPAIEKLAPYKNTWHERLVKEEIKQAAKDGKTKLQFPTGETAMKVEGLGETQQWYKPFDFGTPTRLKINDLKIGKEVSQGRGGDNWIITDILGDGKFKATAPSLMNKVPVQHPGKGSFEITYKGKKLYGYEALKETFDISGKVDTSNPIYKFYEKNIQKYLKRLRPDMKQITDKQGVSWFEIPIKKEDIKAPIEAFGIVGALGLSGLRNNSSNKKQ